MKKILFALLLISVTLTASYAQRVQGTLKKGTLVNEVVVSIKPTQAFNALISNLAVSVQIPKSVGVRPAVSFTNLQPALFATWTQLDQDQGDDYYTWGFNCVAPGASNTDAAAWAATELDVLKISFLGEGSAPFNPRLCHYTDGGTAAYAIFYVETNLAAVNGGVLSDWGSLFYGPGATNGSPVDGSIGVPNASYSFVPVADVALPVKFLSFYALKSGSDAKLTWTVESDNDNKYFDVERSVDGRTYAAFTRVNALDNGKSVNTYETADNGILSNNEVYYRIKQVDKNGTVTYSLIRNLKLDKNLAISLYPNPARATTKLVLDAQFAGKASISIRDVAGKQVQLQSIQLVKGINQHNLNIQTLPAGEYNVTIIGEKLNQTIKLSKIN